MAESTDEELVTPARAGDLDGSGEPRESLAAEPAVPTDKADDLKEVRHLISGLPQSQGAALAALSP